uniref:Glutaredoxin 2 n=1 Tax=Vibrio splendidus TaxID=29497 RepID=A0A0H3ZQ98_VIBSP|nr:Glutaredoxin 2 [Vibrio splendidus]
MTLYIYEHCPFCARVRYVAAVLNIPLNVVIVAYDDDTTTVDLIGAKQVPVLRKEDGECVAESLDIIDYLIELAGSSDHRKPSLAALKWQQAAFFASTKTGVSALGGDGIARVFNRISALGLADQERN